MFVDVLDGGAVVHEKPKVFALPLGGVELQCDASGLHFDPVDVLVFVLWLPSDNYSTSFKDGFR